MATFDGFSREAIDFLTELRENNDRAWFQPRKAEYERLLKHPLEDLEAAAAGLCDERAHVLRPLERVLLRRLQDHDRHAR